jgi:hypothetical protein
MYNKLMGGVDMADQLLTTYYPSVKSVWLWDVIQDTRFVRQQQPRISEVRRTNLQRTTEKSPTRDAHGLSSGAV